MPIHPDGHLMRFAALPVLMDENVHCAPVLVNRIIRLTRLNSQKAADIDLASFLPVHFPVMPRDIKKD
ncbi:hypothetical protein FHW16_001789 [Phyllobacterium myrsinacearum]|uniref:Uncharacterized protein n=1 Tax=Phyllobacterium myrsinacearum TaxID=28101 RepID=A0A839ENR8_9HYPH|nr:hypothetical protein [Phyllobacterium myrsinacearum]